MMPFNVLRALSGWDDIRSVPMTYNQGATMPKVQNWIFDIFTSNGHTFDPNTWVITRDNGLVCITTEDGALIDTPNDTGQSDLDATIWGIGWLHAHCHD
jgi:hypothetical protein